MSLLSVLHATALCVYRLCYLDVCLQPGKLRLSHGSLREYEWLQSTLVDSRGMIRCGPFVWTDTLLGAILLLTAQGEEGLLVPAAAFDCKDWKLSTESAQ